MKYLILLTTIVLACQLVKGNGHPGPTATVYCNDDHTVDIKIYNVDDVDEWVSSEWRLQNDSACDPTLDKPGLMVNYQNLALPDCAYRSLQGNDYIKYILKIEAKKPDPAPVTQQLRAYDHLYYVSCEYDNQNRSMTSFVPIVNRNDNDTDNAFFTFSLQAFPYANHTGVVPDPIKLDVDLYFKVYVDTQSANPNLDLFIVKCFSSESIDPDVNANNFDLIVDGCGNDTVSQDLDDTLMYNCTDDSIKETFKLRTYRYFGALEGSKVYIHCELRVCLANYPNSACECPSVAQCDPASRKKRSVEDVVDEAQVYRVTSGPFSFESEEEGQKPEVNEEEGEAGGQEESQSFSTNLVVIAVVSGVVALAVCATIFLVLRSRNKRRQHGDVSIPT